MTRRRLMAGGAGAVVLSGWAGCLDDEDSDESSDGTDGGDSDENESEADLDGELPTDPEADLFVDRTDQDIVEIETRRGEDDEPQFLFDPPFVTVSTGTVMRWVNRDGVFHSVTSTESLENRSESDRFNETIASEGDVFEWEAGPPGTQHYYCTPHAGFMFGSIEILDS